MLTTASTALQAVGASGLRVLGGGSRGASLLRVLQQSAAQHRAVADAGTAALALQRQHRHREWWPSTSSSSGPAPSCHALSAANSCHLHLPSRGLCTSLSPASAASGEDGDAAAPRRRRRSATESNAALRRTTESRAAIEDVAVMSRSQLLRRNKPWLAEQCWQHGLSHEGLKEDLIQRLLAWQGTEAGQAAAAAAQAAAAAARAAVAAAMGAAAGPHAPPAAAPPHHPAAAGVVPATSKAALGHNSPSSPAPAAGRAAAAAAAPVPPSPPAAAAAASTAAAEPRQQAAQGPQLARPAGACAAAVALPVEEDQETGNTAAAADASSSSSSGQAAAAAAGAQVGWQAPPRSAAAAAADAMDLFLAQLQEQPRNAALVAAARNAVEQYTNQLLSTATGDSGSSSSGGTPQLVSQLAATLSQHSTPQSLAALAKACYSREIQNPVLAASLAEAVAAVAAQLGPQEVYGVLRLLVEHLGSEAEDPVGFRTMDKGFRVLAEGMIRCSDALKPVQLAEAVELLGLHGYDDAFGLWMIAKAAAARLTEFDPAKEGGSVVQLLDAVAGMCVADDAMTSDVAAAVGARRGEYSSSQLAAITAALQRMGCAVEW